VFPNKSGLGTFKKVENQNQQIVKVTEYVDIGWEKRAYDMVGKTWNALKNGGDGKVYQKRTGNVKIFRKTRRSLKTYWDTHHVEGSKVTEALVGIGIGIGIAILSSSVLAASVGTFGALPIAMAIGILLALVTKQIFKIYRNQMKKKLALEWLEKIENDPNLKPELEQDNVAAAFISELYKDIPKIDWALKKYVHFEMKDEQKRFELTGVRDSNRRNRLTNPDLKRDFLKFAQNVRSSTRLHSGSEYEEEDPRKLEVELGVRAKRVIAYTGWLDKYFDILREASQELEANQEHQGLVDLEDQVMELVALQVSASGNHTKNGCKQCCFGPPPPGLSSDWKEAPMDKIREEKFRLNSDILNRMKELKNKGLSDLANDPSEFGEVEGSLSTVGFDDVKDTTLDNIVGTTQGLPYTILTNDHIVSKGVDPLANLVTHGTQGFDANLIGHVGHVTGQEILKQAGGAAVGSAVFAPVGFLISQGLGLLLENLRQNRPVQNKVSKMRQNFHGGLSKQEVEKFLLEMAKDLDQSKVLRALEMSANHYPKRIKDRLDKLMDLCNQIKLRTPVIDLKGCDEAQALVRYVLKINNNIEKQILNVALLQIWVRILSKRCLHESA